MRRYRSCKALIFTFLVLCTSCSFSSQKPGRQAAIVSAKAPGRPLRIASAASMQRTMRALTEAFHRETGITCTLITGSSGQLSAQIMAGAPFDIFAAANMEYPQALYRNGDARRPPETYAYGRLVLWTAAGDLRPVMAHLGNSRIHRIAVANPETAPFGKAALEALTYYRLHDKVKHKLIYGQNITQASRFILSGAADIGFTSLSVVKSSAMTGRGRWIILDTTVYRPIAQGIVQLGKPHNRHKGSRQFYDFMFSERAREIMKKFGYAFPRLKALPRND